MPIIRIDFDRSVVSTQDVAALGEATRTVLTGVVGLGLEEMLVYASSPEVSANVAPIEVFVEVSDHLVPDLDKAMIATKEGLAAWKARSGFPHPINLTIVPMRWKIELGI